MDHVDHCLPKRSVDTLLDPHKCVSVFTDPGQYAVLPQAGLDQLAAILVGQHIVIKNRLLVDAERKHDQNRGYAGAVLALGAVE